MSSFIVCRGDARSLPFASGSVHTCVTSPPYFGLRDYGVAGQLGLEKTPEQYVAGMVEVFREVWRVLRDDGTLWLNIGDSYAGSFGAQSRDKEGAAPLSAKQSSGRAPAVWGTGRPITAKVDGCKPKDLIGIPWMLAFALRADGWYLRSDIIWSKPNPMPESVTDRPTKAHEYLFLLTKSARYYYDAEAIAEESGHAGELGKFNTSKKAARVVDGRIGSGNEHPDAPPVPIGATRNRRSVWTVTTQPFPEAHFATFPPALIEPCILAGTSEYGCCAKCGAPWERVTEGERVKVSDSKRYSGVTHRNDGEDGRFTTVRATTGWQPACSCNAERKPCTVLDPFTGSGTTGEVAIRHGRNFVGTELNAEYARMARKRTGNAPLSLFGAA